MCNGDVELPAGGVINRREERCQRDEARDVQ